MKFHTEYLTLHTKTKRAYVHLTPQVESALKKSGIKDGMILVDQMVAAKNDPLCCPSIKKKGKYRWRNR